MKFLTTHHRRGETYVLVGCPVCRTRKIEKMISGQSFRCSCGKQPIEKYPLTHLKYGEPTMFIYRILFIKTAKKYIGSVIENSRKGYEKQIIQDLQRIREVAPDTPISKFLSEFNMSVDRIIEKPTVRWKVLYEPDSTTGNKLYAMSKKEQLYIDLEDTMNPKGYNHEYTLKNIIEV